MRRTLLGLLVASLLLTGCGDDDDTEATAESTTSTTEADSTTTTAESGTSPSDTTASAELPGERMDIFPYEGTTVAVVGVDAGDRLNVREAPGSGAEVVAELDPLADDIAASGHNRRLDDGSLWAEVRVGGVTGWANTEYLAHLGPVTDITAELYPGPADRPSAETMLELGEAVASPRAGQDEPQPRIVVVAAPSVGDVGEVTLDVVGYPDDSVLGERLHVFAEPDPGGESFTLRSVESTTLCRRGVSDGRCV